MFRVPGPIAAGDTATIVPKRFKYVKATICSAGVNDLPAQDSNARSPTQVTITMRSSAASGQSVHVELLGKQFT